MLSDREFGGKVVVISGAASGICRAIVTAFVERGAKGVLADVDEDYGQHVASELHIHGGDALFVKTDVADSTQVARLFERAVETYGGVDVAIHGADIRVRSTVAEMPEEEWDLKLGVVLKGAFLMCREAARQMIVQGRGGRLINIGSTGAAVARIGSASHHVSKTGVVALTRVLAMELGPHGITANVVAPGLTEVAGPSRKGPTSEEYTRNFVREVPMGRLARYDEMVHATLFFASEEAKFVTGQVLCVDGGYSAGKLGVQGSLPRFVPKT